MLKVHSSFTAIAQSGLGNKVRALVTLALLSVLGTANAHQAKDGDIYATLGTYIYRTHPRLNSFASPIQAGPALLVEADIDQNGGIEIGMFYMRNRYGVREQDRMLVEWVKRMHISLGYRHWFNTRFSGAAAFASSYAMGDAQVVRDDSGPLPHHGTSARDITEYGFDFSLQYEPWRDGRWSAIVGATYGLSITPKRGEDGNIYGMLVALKYFVQSRQEIDE